MAPDFASLAQKTLRGLVRLCVIAAIMMAISWLLENVLTRDTFAHLTRVQIEALGAVKSIDPIQVGERYVCALRPSVETINEQIRISTRDPRLAYESDTPLSTDCMYQLSDIKGAPHGQLPSPVVGHWAETFSFPVFIPLVAFLDTAWHIVVQPSFFGSVFAIATVAMAAILTTLLLGLTRQPYNPWLSPVAFAVGTIVLACLVALCLQGLMEGGLIVFGRITNIAGLCVGSAGITSFGFTFFTKAADVKIHDVVENIVPH
jgi:hypothetical protein